MAPAGKDSPTLAPTPDALYNDRCFLQLLNLCSRTPPCASRELLRERLTDSAVECSSRVSNSLLTLRRMLRLMRDGDCRSWCSSGCTSRPLPTSGACRSCSMSAWSSAMRADDTGRFHSPRPTLLSLLRLGDVVSCVICKISSACNPVLPFSSACNPVCCLFLLKHTTVSQSFGTTIVTCTCTWTCTCYTCMYMHMYM